MLKWTPKSEQDLDWRREHIAKNLNIDLAIEAINDMVDYVERILSANPLAGAVLESNPLFSKLVYKGNSIFYCENPKDKNLYVVYVQARGSGLSGERMRDDELL